MSCVPLEVSRRGPLEAEHASCRAVFYGGIRIGDRTRLQGSSDAGSLAGEERKQLAELEPGKGKRQESIRQPCYPNLWDSECVELIGMAARDLHAKYPKVLAGYMDIAKQRHGIDSTANATQTLWDSECAELIGMAARDLHAKYPKVLAGYMDIANKDMELTQQQVRIAF
nr:hypothetical protein Iba_chr02dCG1420 [Ipomoea batatas]